MSTASTVSAQYDYPTMYSQTFDIVIPGAQPIGSKTMYFPVAWFCTYLGIDKRTQVEVLRRDSRMVPDLVLREAPFCLHGPWRMWLSIRKPEFPLWIMGIDPMRCKPEVQNRLMDFQAEVIRLADQVLFGAAPNVPANKIAVVTYSQRERITFVCMECGAPHVIEIEDGRVQVLRERTTR